MDGGTAGHGRRGVRYEGDAARTERRERRAPVPLLVRRQWALRLCLVWAIEVVTLAATARVLPGLSVTGWRAAVLGVAAIGLLNALLRPLLLWLTHPLNVLTLGVWSLGLNAVSVLVATRLVPGVHVAGLWAALAATLALSAVNTLLHALLALDDDAAIYRRLVVRRIARRGVARAMPPRGDGPAARGAVILEIDGLSRTVLEHAMAAGYMPTLARWVASGTHRLASWDCGLPSQTSASQAGILFGTNHDIPAFRWYEKERDRLLSSNRRADMAEIERRLAGPAMLLPEGASFCNMFSGGAPRSVLTVSTLRYLGPGMRQRGSEMQAYFLNPYTFARSVVLMACELVVEWWGAARQRLAGVTPRVSRGGAYPFLRAVSTVLLRDITVHLVIENLYAGVPLTYATFAGYDVVAHYAGVQRADALRVLRGLDDRIAQLERAARLAGSTHELVVLSDHGQSEGASFRQRSGKTLAELVRSLVDGARPVRASVGSDEAQAHLAALLAEALPAGEPAPVAAARADAAPGRDAVVVCASGNLGLVYFNACPGRASLEQIAARFPGLVDTLVAHPGIGFVLVRSAEHGATVLGRDGTHHLATGRVHGRDPLAPFGPRAADHLRRLDGYPHVGDLVVNSVVDADGSVAAFEEQVGSHGGLGGLQTEAFILAPAAWAPADGALVGAPAVNELLRHRGGHTAPEWSTDRAASTRDATIAGAADRAHTGGDARRRGRHSTTTGEHP